MGDEDADVVVGEGGGCCCGLVVVCEVLLLLVCEVLLMLVCEVLLMRHGATRREVRPWQGWLVVRRRPTPRRRISGGGNRAHLLSENDHQIMQGLDSVEA